jgi:hypothetical protein
MTPLQRPDREALAIFPVPNLVSGQLQLSVETGVG